MIWYSSRFILYEHVRYPVSDLPFFGSRSRTQTPNSPIEMCRKHIDIKTLKFRRVHHTRIYNSIINMYDRRRTPLAAVPVCQFFVVVFLICVQQQCIHNLRIIVHAFIVYSYCGVYRHNFG